MGSYKVLIAEDEGLIARDIANRLEALGHAVVATAGTAEEALEHAGDAEVVLMDIRLDGPRDGIDAAREIRGRFHLPVIFLTAHADRNTLERAKLAEPFGYIVKPMAPAALQTTLEIAMYKHRMERAVELRESRLRTTLSSVSDAVVATDLKGSVLLCNQAAQELLKGPENVPEAGDLEATGSAIDLARFFPDDPMALAILRDAPVAIDATVRDQAVEGSAAPVRVSGATVGAVLTLRNVTVKRWQEQQLRQAQKMDAAARLAAGVSADYTTLLAIISRETRRLLSRFPGPSHVRQSLEDLQRAALDAQELTQRLAGLGIRRVGRPEVLSLNRLLRPMHKTVQSLVAGEGRLAGDGGENAIEVVMRIDPAVGRIRADPEQLHQMILNLVTLANSWLAEGSARGPRALWIETKQEGGYVGLYVTAKGASERGPGGSCTDSGAADAGSLDAAFDPSAELELSLAHAIASDYGALLTTVEEDDRKGFRVLLPVWQPADATPENEEKPHTILLIEPRESVRRQLHNFFEAAGYNLLEAADQDEAATLLEIHGYRGCARSDSPAPSEPAFPGLPVDLVLGDSVSTQGIQQVKVVLMDRNPVQAMSQKALLKHVRELLAAADLTFSASV